MDFFAGFVAFCRFLLINFNSVTFIKAPDEIYESFAIEKFRKRMLKKKSVWIAGAIYDVCRFCLNSENWQVVLIADVAGKRNTSKPIVAPADDRPKVVMVSSSDKRDLQPGPVVENGLSLYTPPGPQGSGIQRESTTSTTKLPQNNHTTTTITTSTTARHIRNQSIKSPSHSCLALVSHSRS